MAIGSVTRRNGGWCIRLDAGVEPETGRRRQISRQGFRTRRDAQAALNDLRLEFARDRSSRSGQVLSLSAYLDDWLDRTRHRLRPSTVSRYRKALAHVTRHLGTVPLRTLSPLQVQRFETALCTGDYALSAKTVANIHAVLHEALADAVRLDLLDRNSAAAVDPPRPERRQLTVWTSEQARQFLEATRGHRLYPAYVLLLTTGMRRSEVLGLQWGDVDFDHATVSIRRTLTLVDGKAVVGAPKSRHNARLVPLDHHSLEILRDHHRTATATTRESAAWVFTGVDAQRVNPASFSATFDRLVTRAGVPRIRVHDLRHTFATIALQRGVHPAILSDLLGHASIAVTIDLYSQVTPAMSRDAADAVAAPMFEDPPPRSSPGV